jgi:hypothetical protein
MDIAQRYVHLCLRVDRHVEDFVDAYVGPTTWRRSVASEDPVDPAHLRDEANILADALDAADLEPDRRRWLRGQLSAIACITGRLAGEEFAWAEEVERCLGVRPTRTGTEAIGAVHRRLDEALPGSGDLRDRYNAWDVRNAVPRQRLVPALERLNDVLRPRAHELAAMPSEESVAYEVVSGVPWIAYNRYEGHHRSRIEVNADLPVSIVLLVAIAAHESYPGHHTERSAKEARLTRGLGRVETGVAVASTPESLISEGLAQLALEAALGPSPYEVVADALRDLGLRFDPREAQAIHDAELDLYATVTNAAFMLYEDGLPQSEVASYMQTWGLESEERSSRTVRFIADPSARAYVPAYPEGRRLCGAFAARAPGNFSRFLTEQLTTADLLDRAR